MENTNKNNTIKVILMVVLTILLIASVSITAYDNLNKKEPEQNNTQTETDKDESINEEEHEEEETEKVEIKDTFNVNDKIVSLKVVLPVSGDSNKTINITKTEDFNKISNIIKGLKLKDEKLPEGIGFEHPYKIIVQFEKETVEFILTGDNDLCVLSSGNIYETTKEKINSEYLDSLK